MKCVITVIGNDKVGIIALVANRLAEVNVNILDISQTIMQNMFTMIMLCDASKSTVQFNELADNFEKLGRDNALSIRLQRQDVFEHMNQL